MTVVIVLLLAYVVAAYVVVPYLWIRYAHRHPELDSIPRITYTADDIPGDPLNVALVGDENPLKDAMKNSGWYPADALSLKSDLKIAEATVLERPYDEAPVSSLFFEGRKEDLAFEKPVGDDPKQRHHVRFWKLGKPTQFGLPIWIGSVTYDRKVGFSHTTGQITHHIDGNVDAERDALFRDLEQSHSVDDVEYIDDFHKIREGKNGGGDAWHTDGRLLVGEIIAK